MKLTKHNADMKAFLEANGIICRVKRIDKGSMKGQWRFYQPDVQWYDNFELQQKFIDLGFICKYKADWHGGHGIDNYSGNGGAFCVFFMHPNF